MATIVTRAGKGMTLTHVEVDANFTNLNTAKVETSAIGVTVQPYSANLDEFATVNPTTAGLAILDDATAADQRTTLGAAASGAVTSSGLTQATAKILGRTTASTGAIEEIGVDSTLTLAAGSLGVNTSAISTISVPVRQTVLSGATDSNGYASALTTGSGLRPGLDASPTAMTIAFANGFGSAGSTDLVSVLSADASDPLGADLPVNNLSYLYATYSSATAVTWGSTLNSPQYGYAYDRTRQSLLRFAGTDGSTTILDDYGNTWTVSGNAQIDTAVKIDGLNTLLLDGTGDYIETTSISTLPSDSWQMELKVRFNVLPSVGVNMGLIRTFNGTTGLFLGLNNSGGVYKLILYASSNGTSADIASGQLGTSTTWATGTTYHIALGYDMVAGKYFAYKDGVSDTSVTSTARIASFNSLRLGDASNFGTNTPLNGAIAGFRFSPFCCYPNGTTFTAPDISTFAVEGHFFSRPEMKMYEVTAASETAGVNPTLTQRNRVFVGEAVTSGAAVTAATTYAYRGEYEKLNAAPLPSSSTETVFSHNIGVIPAEVMPFAKCVSTDLGYIPRDIVDTGLCAVSDTAIHPAGGRRTALVAGVSAASGSWATVSKSGGSSANMTSSRWALGLRCKRGW